MKIVFRILAFALAFIVPLLFFQTFDAGFEIIEQKKWVAFLHIPITAFLFTWAVNWSIRDAFKSLYYKVVEEDKVKKVFNPFWGWYIATGIIQFIITRLYE
ncbi:MAG: hypothetical protein KF862_07155 [Chitinophagaceae bacterium]|nr:hypothetical protein [Chitinophagaceae bacterium]